MSDFAPSTRHSKMEATRTPMLTIAVAACLGVGVGLLARASVTPDTLLYGVAPATSTSSTTLGSSAGQFARSAHLVSRPGAIAVPSQRSFADSPTYQPQTYALDQTPATLGVGLVCPSFFKDRKSFRAGYRLYSYIFLVPCKVNPFFNPQ